MGQTLDTLSRMLQSDCKAAFTSNTSSSGISEYDFLVDQKIETLEEMTKIINILLEQIVGFYDELGKEVNTLLADIPNKAKTLASNIKTMVSQNMKNRVSFSILIEPIEDSIRNLIVELTQSRVLFHEEMHEETRVRCLRVLRHASNNVRRLKIENTGLCNEIRGKIENHHLVKTHYHAMTEELKEVEKIFLQCQKESELLLRKADERVDPSNRDEGQKTRIELKAAIGESCKVQQEIIAKYCSQLKNVLTSAEGFEGVQDALKTVRSSFLGMGTK